MESRTQQPLPQAIDEIISTLMSLKTTGSARIGGVEVTLPDRVDVEAEIEVADGAGELEFELKWPASGHASSPLVAILCGSASDLPLLEKSRSVLSDLDVPHEVRVLSAHRTPAELLEYVGSAKDRGIEVFIAAAGGAAHLAGVVAAHTTAPVIGLPVPSQHLSGLDSLLSIVQMPKGVPVASVAIGGAENAAILAVQILALKYPELSERLGDLRTKQAKAVLGEAPSGAAAPTNGSNTAVSR
jgi:5-(carboxyamino)imidazole ribonucleotide mutase